MPTITYDHDLFQARMAILQLALWAKKDLAYIKCVRETGGDWTNPDCMKLLWPVGPVGAGGGPQDPGLLEDLLAQMPEDVQGQVAASILEAQEHLIEQYTAEVDELIHTL